MIMAAACIKSILPAHGQAKGAPLVDVEYRPLPPWYAGPYLQDVPKVRGL